MFIDTSPPPISREWFDAMKRQKVDRLLWFLNQFDDNRRVKDIEVEVNTQGYLLSVEIETASGERYQREMDIRMRNRLEVFENITLHFNTLYFRDDPEAEALIEKSFILLETLFRVDEHLFDFGITQIGVNGKQLSEMNTEEAVYFVRAVHTLHLDEGLHERFRHFIDAPAGLSHWIIDAPGAVRAIAVPPPGPTKKQDQEGVEAFIAEMDALLSEEDDPTPPPENQLPKAMPTG